MAFVRPHGTTTAFLALLIASICACTPATEILVSVDTDAPVLRGVHLQLTVLAGAVVIDGGADASLGGTMALFVRGDGGSLALPGSFAVVPAAGQANDSIVTLIFDTEFAPATARDAPVRTRRIARVAFTPHSTVHLPVFLSLTCGLPTTGCASVAAAECTYNVLCHEQPGQTCGDNGSCVSINVLTGMDASIPPCDAGMTRCGSTCSSVASDPNNCGACGRVCGPIGNRLTQCISGACRVPCPMGQVMCGGACVDLASDVFNCGACGLRCASSGGGTATCAAGACGIACPGSTTLCSGTCVDTQTSVMNCSMCGRTCPGGGGGTGVCVAGVCGIGCPGARRLCSGTCVDVQSDASNCGMCGHACPSTGGGTGVCQAGNCTIACPAGLTLCGGNCVNTASDLANCGSCGRACPPAGSGGATCGGGACGFTCPAGWSLCGASCFDLANDANHCGGCGTACNPSGVPRGCAGGRCVPDCGGAIDGYYCGNDRLGADPNTLYRCAGGGPVYAYGCPHGCRVRPSGTNDECIANCGGQINGLYCGNDRVGGDPNILYSCSGGGYSVSAFCTRGCHVAPSGTNDYCN